jgi:hypothetical protein
MPVRTTAIFIVISLSSKKASFSPSLISDVLLIKKVQSEKNKQQTINQNQDEEEFFFLDSYSGLSLNVLLNETSTFCVRHIHCFK